MCAYMCIHTHAYVYMCTCLYVYVCIHIYIYIYICMCYACTVDLSAAYCAASNLDIHKSIDLANNTWFQAMCLCVSLSLYICIYIYIYREREISRRCLRSSRMRRSQHGSGASCTSSGCRTQSKQIMMIMIILIKPYINDTSNTNDDMFCFLL